MASVAIANAGPAKFTKLDGICRTFGELVLQSGPVEKSLNPVDDPTTVYTTPVRSPAIDMLGPLTEPTTLVPSKSPSVILDHV